MLYFLNNNGILCDKCVRNDNIAKLLYDELQGIKYFEKDNQKYYYIGKFKSSAAINFARIPRIRTFTIIQGEDFFLDILKPLYLVEFVKWGGNPVVPFPVKYLDEMIIYHY